MGLEEQLREHVTRALAELVADGTLDAQVAGSAGFNVEPPRKGGSGHVATNVALVLAKPAARNPRQLAELIAVRLASHSDVHGVDIAGPGFMNVNFDPRAFRALLREVLSAGRNYGRAPAASGERINVEFVSANPTGPLLISHGRGAVVGDVVARLLEAAGHRVTREYYINDYGNQVRLLAESVRAIGRGEDPPEGGYGGFYVQDLARYLGKSRPELLAAEDEPSRAELSRTCTSLMLDGIPGSDMSGIRRTLDDLGIEFDVWSSEEALHRWSKVTRALEQLEAAGRLTRADDGAVLFVTGEEDDKDRVVKKRDGTATYFAGDIAYHKDKLARGFERLINVWGADHHGYVARTRSVIEALGHDPATLEVVLFQLVSLLRDGKPYRMGKRLGNLITIQEISEEIDAVVKNPRAGRDALRFFFLSRRTDTPIVLDVELAKKQERENPVFYIQYGHARLCSILRRAREKFGVSLPLYTDALAARIEHPLELGLLAQLGRYPATLRDAAAGREPHKIIFYLQQIAQDFQSYYTELYRQGDSILPRDRDKSEGWEQRWDWEKTRARLLWIDAIRVVYRSGLELLGLEAPERMSREAEEAEGD